MWLHMFKCSNFVLLYKTCSPIHVFYCSVEITLVVVRLFFSLLPCTIIWLVIGQLSHHICRLGWGAGWLFLGMICCLMRHFGGNSGPGCSFLWVEDILYLVVLVLDMVRLDSDTWMGVVSGLLSWDALLCFFFPWEEDDILSYLENYGSITFVIIVPTVLTANIKMLYLFCIIK